MIREIISKVNRSLSERMVSARRRHTALIKIWFDPDVNSERAVELARSSCIVGETVDISRTGIGFVVPSIRVKEKYLVGQERKLNVEIDLPTGKIQMRAIGRRYKKVGIHISTEKFLVGAQILDITGPDKENYERFLRNGNRRVKAPPASLELGID
jgi:c-di-GMP-binding flagellar brake protein YcgR